MGKIGTFFKVATTGTVLGYAAGVAQSSQDESFRQKFEKIMPYAKELNDPLLGPRKDTTPKYLPYINKKDVNKKGDSSILANNMKQQPEVGKADTKAQPKDEPFEENKHLFAPLASKSEDLFLKNVEKELELVGDAAGTVVGGINLAAKEEADHIASNVEHKVEDKLKTAPPKSQKPQDDKDVKQAKLKAEKLEQQVKNAQDRLGPDNIQELNAAKEALLARISVLEIEIEKMEKQLQQERRQAEDDIQHTIEVNTQEWKQKLEEILDKERQLAEQKLQEALLLRNQEHNGNLVKQQQHLETLYNTYYQKQLAQEAEKIHEAAHLTVTHKLAKERAQRLAVVEMYQEKVRAIEGKLKDHVNYVEHLNFGADKCQAVIDELSKALHGGKKCQIDQKTMETIFAKSNISLLTLQTIPIDFFNNEYGIGANYSDLVQEFDVHVKGEVTKNSLLPADGGGFLRNIYATVLSSLLFETGVDVDDDNNLKERNDERADALERTSNTLARTEYYLMRHDLYKATCELNQLEGWSRIAAKSWLKKARQYLEVEQAILVLDASNKEL